MSIFYHRVNFSKLFLRCVSRHLLGYLWNLATFFSALSDIVFAAEELRYAAQAIGRITGDIGVEDILDSLFKDFCIGK